MTHCFATRCMAEVVDDGDFLYLDDEVAPQKVKTSKPKKVPKPVEIAINTTPVDSMLLDLVVAGEQSISWPLSGMDCPDCAYKATKALKRLDVVSECSVSATEGSVRLVVDLSKGSLSEANAVLTSLGHAPDLGWNELVGVNATAVSARLDVDQRGLLKLLKRQSGILDAQIDSDGFVLVQISIDCSPSIIEARNASLTNLIGHEVSLRASTSRRLRPDQIRLVGGALAIPAFVLVLGLELTSSGPAWLAASIAIIGILVGGYRMFTEAIASLKNRQIGFQVLTSLAVIGAAILQAWSEALLVIILVAFTAHMEGSALVRAREAMQGGLDRIPRMARQVKEKSKPKQIRIATSQDLAPFNVKKTTPATEDVPISLLRIGDKVEVRSGEIIPVDGEVLEGTGSVDRAPLTGESIPVRVKKGDEVLAGLVLKQGPLIIQTSATGDDTRLSGLIEDVHTFREKPPRLQSSVEVFTALWIPLVLLGAPLAWFLSGDVENWKLMLLLWVVACPCALLLAAPVPHAASLANAARSGAIARGGDVMERLGRVNLALLDKTGTLTSGKPRLEQIIMANNRQESAALKLARGIEARSSHPYAAVVMEYTDDLQEVKVNEHQDGEAGVIAKQGTAKVYFGRPDWLQSEGVSIPKELQSAIEEAKEAGHGASLLSKSAKAIALFVFVHDDIRPGAEDLIKDLHLQKVNVEILSGDLTTATQAFGPRVGLPAAACRGDLSPDDKASWVGARSKTHVTMMAGDGFNDAAALANSDVGIAIGSGEQVNLEAADVLVPSDDPRLIGNLLRLAKKTRTIVAQNILISVLITLILVWSVLAQFNDQLWIGVLVHEASAILVILNGARLSGDKGMLRMLLDLGIDLWNDTTDAFKALRGI